MFGVPAALERVEQLEAVPLFEVNATRIRILYHLSLGNAQQVKKCGFRATQVTVEYEPEHVHRHLSHITAMIDGSRLTDRQKDLARRVFSRLAEAEALVVSHLLTGAGIAPADLLAVVQLHQGAGQLGVVEHVGELLDPATRDAFPLYVPTV